MRILIANDGFGHAGGVQRYLESVVAGLGSRGHEIAMLYRETPPDVTFADGTRVAAQFDVAKSGMADAFDGVRRWKPDVCFSHNMSDLEIDRRLLDESPVVKFMHGYSGTCVGGQKMFRMPDARPCGRTFGPPCLALYLPRRCGEFSVPALLRQYRWAAEQHALFSRYRAIVVASEHMKREYVRNGADAAAVHVNPLFVTHEDMADGSVSSASSSAAPVVVFVGRMTTLKGGDVLIRAVADASERLDARIALVMIGDGPQRAPWEALAARLRVSCTFTGWLGGDDRWTWLRRASLLAVPSTWPEPFGLVGLEAAALGVPAIAFDVGGIREWLTPGENGWIVPGDPPSASALADALVRAFRHPAELLAMRAKAVAVARRMSIGRHLDRLEAVFTTEDRQLAYSAGR